MMAPLGPPRPRADDTHLYHRSANDKTEGIVLKT